jgi:hypothetical protein
MSAAEGALNAARGGETPEEWEAAEGVFKLGGAGAVLSAEIADRMRESVDGARKRIYGDDFTKFLEDVDAVVRRCGDAEFVRVYLNIAEILSYACAADGEDRLDTRIVFRAWTQLTANLLHFVHKGRGYASRVLEQPETWEKMVELAVFCAQGVDRELLCLYASPAVLEAQLYLRRILRRLETYGPLNVAFDLGQ